MDERIESMNSSSFSFTLYAEAVYYSVKL